MSFKIIIIGDSCVGKTSLARRFVNNSFIESYKSTIGIDFLSKVIKINNKKINLQIWDTAGNERFHAMSPSFYRGADGCIIVFDLTNMLSFKNLENWIDEFLLTTCTQDPESFPFIIIGNKSDLINDANRVISKRFIEKFCESKMIKYFEVSTKFNMNISTAFEYLINKIYKKNNYENIDLAYDTQSINLDIQENQNIDEEISNNYDKIILNSKSKNESSYCYC